MKNLVKLKKGTTNNIYYGNYLLIESTNRVSVSDTNIPGEVMNKGLIHNQMSNMWMDMTNHIIPNHILATDPRTLLILGATPDQKGSITAVKKCIPLPFKCIVRGYYVPSSHSWDPYTKKGQINGVPLPKKLKESGILPYPIFTPATKENNQNISFNVMHIKMYTFMKELISPDNDIDVSDDYYSGFSLYLCREIKRLSIALYEFAHNYALDKGIIIADTKFEFGLDYDFNLTLIGEMLTPDTTRYWSTETYKSGQKQENLSTPTYDPDSKITYDMLQATSKIYCDLYEKLFGKSVTDLISELSFEWNPYI